VTFRSSSDDKERIRQAIDIVDLVGSYTSLRRQGRNYVALCPWHDDSRPSLQVNPERQSFKCWVCNIGGDVFSFLMKMENVEFGEAVAMLAERAGIQLTPYDPRRGGSLVQGNVASEPPSAAARDSDEKRVLYQAAAWAEQLFHECLLRDPEAKPARQYLRDRGISDESIRHFHLGYSPDSWDWLIKQSLRTKKFSHGVLERIGLLGRKQVGGGHYDRFKGRVLFSIRDVQGRPVGIGGRVLPRQAATNPAKYVNSPESPLFSKSNLLYGLDLARNAITKTRTAVVTEGYTDCIIARQAGFENVLAVLGTALGERHIKLLKRFADRVVLVLDGDEAGQKRTGEILSLFLAEQVDLRVVTLPDELDPCDFLLQHGAEEFARHLDSSIDALEHAFRLATRGLDIQAQPHEAQVALAQLLQMISRAPRLREGTTTEAQIREHQMFARLARMFSVDEPMLRRRVGELRSKQRPARIAASQGLEAAGRDLADSAAGNPGGSTKPIDPLHLWDRELLEVLLIEPESVAAAAEVIRPEYLASESGRRIFSACTRLNAAGLTPDFHRLLLEFDEPEYKSLLVELDEAGHARGDHDAAGRLRELLESYRRREEDRTCRATVRALEERHLDAEEELNVLQQMIEQERGRQGISAPTDG
jgi:DNA primase